MKSSIELIPQMKITILSKEDSFKGRDAVIIGIVKSKDKNIQRDVIEYKFDNGQTFKKMRHEINFQCVLEDAPKRGRPSKKSV